MEPLYKQILTNALYLIVLLNPISKISILSVFSSKEDMEVMPRVVVKSTLIAAAILILITLAGDLILRAVFHVELYALSISGGIILFAVGYKALTKGVFFEASTTARFAEFSIVPLASPMIAGPASIAAALRIAAADGYAVAIPAVIIAIGVNMIFMLLSRPIGSVLSKYNVLGALIRITGLIVATMAVQMILGGFSSWLDTLG